MKLRLPSGVGQIYKIVHVPSAQCYVGLNDTMIFYDRIKKHAMPSSGCHKLRNALRSHPESEFTLQILDSNVPVDMLPSLEIKRIKEHKAMYYDGGFNLREGGKTSPMLSPAIAAKQKATKATPGSFAKMSAAAKEFANRPEVKEAKSKAMIAVCKTIKKKKSDSAKMAMNKPDVKARHKAACNTPTALRNKSNAMKKAHADPASKERRMIALKEAWVRRKATYGVSGIRKA